jgi:hypothetical protein
MAQLFISVYLDEDVDIVIGDVLRARGYDVLTTLEAQRLSTSDEEQLAYATSLERTLLTHNRVHFEDLAKSWFHAARPHAGIIIATRRDYSEIARRLLIVLNSVTADEIYNQVRYI